ncbi:hypothetical protein [Xylophilus ampelinus]|uniref:DUF5666 domain-containing protein n=1 Tax=Xylophilus ampelinus TaxID=54067 RepID=A0A318SHS4_9BURK|nr:hypothetical protein [Xylophilus ampelinus]MCS4510482.1 hypothetical protein [Xylophilus ampelinus]PYE77937.1 hypothetical protein DFQ15_11182 [Xylophilus ampelinus]
MHTQLSRLFSAGALTALALAGSFARAQVPSMPTPPIAEKPVRLRGTLVRVDAGTLTLKERGGEVVTLARAPAMPISEVYPIQMSAIRPGSFIGTAALPQPDGTQKALEVVVFPEAARGTGEGHYQWDLMPESTMTNATVSGKAAAPKTVPGGQQLVLQYKGGEKTVIVPADVPVVSLKPGNADEKALLVPGAKVLVHAQLKDGQPVALRVNVGRNGFAPPM